VIAATVPKMETNRQSNLKDDTSNKNDTPQSKKRKQPTGHTDTTNTNTDDDTVNLSETTTVDDISTMDVSTYLAWVNRQAKSLPNVFVATSPSTQDKDTSIDQTHTKEQQTAPANTNAKEDSNDNKSIVNGGKEMKEEEEEPFHGSRTTLQILLSKRMDILPPPTVRHLPPHYNVNTAVSLGDDDVKMSVTSTGGECNDSNRNGSKSSWVSNTISNFSKLRSYLETQRTKQQSQQRGATSNRKIAVPRMKDRAAWHIFCLGKEEAYGNVGGYYEDDEEEDDADAKKDDVKKIEAVISIKEDESDKVESTEEGAVTQQPSTSQTPPQSKLIYNPSNIPIQGYTPHTSLILQFDQVLTRTLFHHHVHYLCEWKFTLSYNRCIWIYSLLGNMEKPLHIDEVCGVRRVLRECCLRRWELKLPNEEEKEDAKQSTIDKSRTSASASEDKDVKQSAIAETKKAAGSCCEQLALLNTLIAITGIYFEQGNAATGDCMDSLFSVKPLES